MRVNSIKNQYNGYSSPNFGNSKRIFLCSPLTLGTDAVTEISQKNAIMQANLKKAEEYCRKLMLNGDYPYAPHLYATRFADEHNPDERTMGINIGLAFLRLCDALCVFSKTGKLGKGMGTEIKEAAKNRLPIIFIKDGTDCPDEFIKSFANQNNININILEDSELGKIDTIIEENR